MPVAIFWFRRDLRLHDNAGLYHALRSGQPVLPLFIFDTNILDDLPERRDARVEFIHRALAELKQKLEALGSTLLVRHGKPPEVWAQLLREHDIKALFTNRDYEPYALERDAAVQTHLSEKNIPFHTSKDHVIFEKNEVLKDDGTPYTVFTPYSRKWRAKLETRWKTVLDEEGRLERASFYLSPYPTEKYAGNFLKTAPLPFPTLTELGFEPAGIPFPPAAVARGLIRTYDKTRDFPGMAGTSRLGVHFRFGTISIREKARHAQMLNDTYLNELIWRDFYSQILAHFPHVAGSPFKPQYDRVPWRHAPDDFQRWCAGQTGYPIVDAGMRELNATGYMHNRVRMITASFLTKHLLLDWRLGEAYFAQKLLDYDLASNNGGWQWAAGCGTDAAPYFRIFNPAEQTKKFDPERRYILRWVPEVDTARYPKPMVEHTFARGRGLDAFKRALE
ncbi:MAG: deoxyribodipyrimidine photo-lyase [Saprospiraceae bacterium]|jgi:deoxyribodipyrimidine photo-lyase|nr:deoxyribodipyrimidine photo-lyase [Saprospiraceae bacterium]